MNKYQSLINPSKIEDETPIGTPIGIPKLKVNNLDAVLDKLSCLMEDSILDQDLTMFRPAEISHKCMSG
jgi:hypothetical protein